jgi:hypothetical protein
VLSLPLVGVGELSVFVAIGLPWVNSIVPAGVSNPCDEIGVINGVALPGAGGPNGSVVGAGSVTSGVCAMVVAISDTGVLEATVGGSSVMSVGNGVGLAGGGAVSSARVGAIELPAVWKQPVTSKANDPSTRQVPSRRNAPMFDSFDAAFTHSA